ncbi:MAG: HEAT repeat domain-containing protein [Candidatus Fermentibacteraceae bacterium]
MLTALLIAALAPAPQLPAEVDSALTVCLDSLDITRGQMNFDRHWSRGVALPDSTVLKALTDIHSLPAILSGEVSALPDGSASYGGDDPMADLLLLLEERAEAYSAAFDSAAGAGDTLACLLPVVFADADHPGEWGSPGALHRSWGLAEPVGPEVEPDSLAGLLSRWPVPPSLDPDTFTCLALELGGMRVPAADMTAPGVEGAVADFDTAGPVSWVIGGPGPNTYTGGFDLIIDIGGDDTYRGHCAAAAAPAGRFVAVVVDLAGDDRYLTELPGAQGSGFGGLGVLVDLAGDDTYTAGALSQGCGLAGQGLLADLEGDDTYRADYMSQGAAMMGRGDLLDAGGDDSYRVAAFGQGFGGPAGRGTLCDRAGHDSYLAGFRYPHEPLLREDHRAMSQGFAMGLRPFVAGGVGLLADLGSGNDTYRAEVFGQGAAYFYGLGMLYDQDGQDSYTAAQYSQGSGIHLAAGCLWEGGGDDVYVSRRGPAQGSAHDLSTGFLLDADGDDWYCSDGGQALALTNSACIFADLAGDDVYAAAGGGQGEAPWRRGFGGAAVFLDLADDDRFLGPGGGELWRLPSYGVGADLPRSSPPDSLADDPIGDPGSLELDSLFEVAAEWAVAENRERVLAHRRELGRRGEEAVAYILGERLNAWDGLELRAMESALKENARLAVPALAESLLASEAARVRGNCAWLLGRMGEPSGRPALEDALDDSLPVGLRATVVEALGRIGEPASIAAIVALARDSSSRVRTRVAAALGAIGDSTAVPLLLELAGDPQLDVRSAAEHALEELGGNPDGAGG